MAYALMREKKIIIFMSIYESLEHKPVNLTEEN